MLLSDIMPLNYSKERLFDRCAAIDFQVAPLTDIIPYKDKFKIVEDWS